MLVIWRIKRILKVSETYERIICPNCNGFGKVIHTKRISVDEDKNLERVCSYCNGKMIVNRRTLIEDLDIE